LIAGVLEAALALALVSLGAWTVAVRGTTAAVIGFVAYGLVLALVWLYFGAVDVSMTEAAIGAGLTGMLFVHAARRTAPAERATELPTARVAVRVAAAVASLAVAGALAAAVLALPEPAPSLAPPVMDRLGALGVANPITGVLLGFRALDTLLESIVVVLALVGVWSISPDGAWGGRPAPAGGAGGARDDAGLAFAARVLIPVGVLIALYVLWRGADHPGGKFQAATLLAAMALLALMAGLAEAPRANDARLRGVLACGPAVFIAIGALGVPMAGAVLAYPETFAKPLILAIEFALVPTLAAALALLVLGPPEGRGP
jgi:multisubunit Na+/H+ antiporter MnhB subunit